MINNDLVNRIKRESHRGDRIITNDNITQDICDCINDAKRDIITFLPQEQLRAQSSFNTVSGQDTYTLDVGVEIPIILRYTLSQHEYIIKKIESEREFYLNIYVANVALNRPYAYINLGMDPTTLGNNGSSQRQVKIYPAPDAPAAGLTPVTGAYTVNYSYVLDLSLPTYDVTPSNLSNNITYFPSPIQDALWKGGLYYFLKGFDDPLQQIAKADFDAALLKISRLENETSDTDLQFRWDTGKIRFVDPATGIRLM